MAKLFSNIWFKCISFLLLLTVALGGTLAILNDVLYVSPEERTARAIQKIYGKEMDFTEPENFEVKEYDNLGRINKLYYIGEDQLFQATGYNGYKNGTITLWIRVVKNGTEYKINKIVMESYEKQTLMSKLDGSFYQKFYIDVTNDSDLFTPDSSSASSNKNPVSGATKSANAACNAVNCVIEYLGGL